MSDAIRNAYQEYLESDEYKEAILFSEVFNDPKGLLWIFFLEGWLRREQMESQNELP